MPQLLSGALRPRASDSGADRLRRTPAYRFLVRHFPIEVVDAAVDFKAMQSIFLKEPTELQQSLDFYHEIYAKEGITGDSSLSLSIFVPEWSDFRSFVEIKRPYPGQERTHDDVPDILSRTPVERDLQIRHLATKQQGAILARLVQPSQQRRVVANQRMLAELVGLTEIDIRNLFLLTPESFFMDSNDLKTNLEGWQAQISDIKQYLVDSSPSSTVPLSQYDAENDSERTGRSSSTSDLLAMPHCANLDKYLKFPHYSNLYVKHSMDDKDAIAHARDLCMPILHTSPEVLQRRLSFVAELFYPNTEARDLRVLTLKDRILATPRVVGVPEKQLQDTFLFLHKLWGTKNGRILSRSHLSLLSRPAEKLIVPFQKLTSLTVMDSATNTRVSAFSTDDLSHMFLKSPRLFNVEHSCQDTWRWLSDTFDRPRDMVLQHLPLMQLNARDHLQPVYSYMRLVGIPHDVIASMPRLLSESLENRVRPRLEYLQYKKIPFDADLNDRAMLFHLLFTSMDVFLAKYLLEDKRVRDQLVRLRLVATARRPLRWLNPDAEQAALQMLKREFNAFKAESRSKGLLPGVYMEALTNPELIPSRDALLGPSWVDQFKFRSRSSPQKSSNQIDSSSTPVV